MPASNRTEVDITVREVLTRDIETNEESTACEVQHENMEGVIREDTPKEALEVFAACLETDNEDAKINIEDLEKEPEPLA